MSAGAVYVGRGSSWGNPFKGPRAMHLYRLIWRKQWMELRLAGVTAVGILDLMLLLDEWKRRLPELRGKDLACWCPLDRECHGDILLERANR